MKRFLYVVLGLSMLFAMPVVSSAAQSSVRSAQAHTAAVAPIVGTVSFGSRGFTVLQVQYVLRSRGYTLHVDEIFGSETQRVVLQFQKDNHLWVDGIVGPQTLKALGLLGGAPLTLPVPPPVKPPKVVTVPGNCATYAPLLIKYSLDVATFTHIMGREAGCIPTSYNYNAKTLDDSYGLTQINTWGANWGELQRRCHLSSKSQLFDPETNISCAAQLKRAYGMSPWGG